MVLGKHGQTHLKIDMLKSKLKPISKQLKQAGTVKELNEVRSLLVKDYNGYAGGRQLFGEKLMPITASSGTYKVIIYYGKEQAESTITLRDDPLDK